jgi:hypothetical protein
MRDFVIRIHEGGIFQSWVHVFYGPSYWAVEFDQDSMISAWELLAVAAVLDEMLFDLEVQWAEEL